MNGSDQELHSRAMAVLRAKKKWTQKKLARALKMGWRALSDLECCRDGRGPSRELLIQAAQVMELPETEVDETLAYLRQKARHLPTRPVRLESELGAIAGRFGAGFEELFRQATTLASGEALNAIERAIGEHLWSYFTALPQPDRLKAVEKEALFYRWGFAERLFEKSYAAASDDAGKALALAEMALIVAERLGGEPTFRRRYEGAAWALIANAKRVFGELPTADFAFARAKVFWNAGEAADLGFLDEGRFYGLEAALRRAQRRFPEAFACMQLALGKARPGTEFELLIWKGNLLVELERHDEALPIYQEALSQSGPRRDPRLVWGARFNYVVCLCALDRPQEADDRLPELREAAVELGNGLDLLRVRWLEGTVQAAFGRNLEAIEIFGEVRDSFMARGILFDAALVSLDRAILQLEEGQTAAVKAEAPELALTFRRLRVAPELLASLTLFCAAAEAERATAEEARHILSLLRQARIGPTSAA